MIYSYSFTAKGTCVSLAHEYAISLLSLDLGDKTSRIPIKDSHKIYLFSRIFNEHQEVARMQESNNPWMLRI